MPETEMLIARMFSEYQIYTLTYRQLASYYAIIRAEWQCGDRPVGIRAAREPGFIFAQRRDSTDLNRTRESSDLSFCCNTAAVLYYFLLTILPV